MTFPDSPALHPVVVVLRATGWGGTGGQQLAPEFANVGRGQPFGAISTPVLVLHGTDTELFWTRFTCHVTDHVPNARTHGVASWGVAVEEHLEEVDLGVLVSFGGVVPSLLTSTV